MTTATESASTPSAALELRHYGDGHLALVVGGVRLDLDPRLPSAEDDGDEVRREARGRLHTDAIVHCRSGSSAAVDDALDILELRTAALVVGRDSDLDRLDRDLELGDRGVSVDAYERVRLGGVRVTRLPLPQRGLGLPIAEAADALPGRETVRQGTDAVADAGALLERATRGLPLVGGLMRAAESVAGGAGVPVPWRRSEGLSWVPAVSTPGHTVVVAGDLSRTAPDASLLDDWAEACPVDTLVVAVSGANPGPLVRAVRRLGPARVVLIRDHDVWDTDTPTLPLSVFEAALREGASGAKVVVMTAGTVLKLG